MTTMATPTEKEFTAEEKETFTLYSDDSSDEYDYKDIIITDTTEIKDNSTG